MNSTRCWLTLRAWFELARYDLANTLLGLRDMSSQLGPQCAVVGPPDQRRANMLCEAVDLAACFYIKRVRCLQRSSVLVRLLRKHGINGLLVIAYRPTPFLMHAWAEVGGRIVGDSSAYHKLLRVLHKF
jgi:Transglutaminase-like superfamily